MSENVANRNLAKTSASSPHRGGRVRVGGAGHLPIGAEAQTQRTALVIPDRMPIAAWRNLGRQIYVIHDSSSWWLGDWLIYGQHQYPDRYKRAIQETSLDYQTLRNYAWVSRQFCHARRRVGLSFQHHAEVASLSHEEQDSWLDRAEEGRWSRNELRRQVKQSQRGTLEQTPPDRVQIQMNIVPDKKELWQEAAGGQNQELLAWIVSILDSAAQRVLEARTDAG